jgi:hypothetical protein
MHYDDEMAAEARISGMPFVPEINNETRLKKYRYSHAASNKISRLLAKCDMKTHHLPVKNVTQGKTDLKPPHVWCIPCGCGKVVRQAGNEKPEARSTRSTFLLGQAVSLAAAECTVGSRQHEIQQH